MLTSAATAPEPRNSLPSISVIVPVYNEANTIEAFLSSVRKACTTHVELIVVDGGSTDETASLARPLCDRLVNATKQRAAQMNAGAQVATANTLWFLHADSQLPQDADNAISDTLARSSGWGCFAVRLSGTRPLLRVVECLMNWRSRLTGIITGDQGMFVARTLFERVGGYPEIALMEDIAMSRILKTSGRPVFSPYKLQTSSRRWERDGIVRTILLMWKLRALYFFGADPDRLANRYYGRSG